MAERKPKELTEGKLHSSYAICLPEWLLPPLTG